MNVSIYNCGLKIVDIFTTLCVFKSLKTELNKNTKSKFIMKLTMRVSKPYVVLKVHS